MEHFEKFMKIWKKLKPVINCSDPNVTHAEADIHVTQASSDSRVHSSRKKRYDISFKSNLLTHSNI